jgi:phenylpropionate dioxygenase-like ring-hydroxylating dioxygenase large terminal subunit
MKVATDTALLAKRALAHLHAKTTDQAPEILKLPVSTYCDPERFHREFKAIFLQKPQALLLSLEIAEPGDYVARTIMTKPLLFVRGKDGVARVFLNVCRHRGARTCPEGKGRASRFTCPYHSWTYSLDGKLVALNGPAKFGEADPSGLGLVELCSTERAGVIWATLEPGCAFDIDDWLGDAAGELEKLQLADWHLFDQRDLPGPGWKVTMDGYLEAYHHDTVHANTLAKHTIGNLLLHDVYGHHQILTFGRRNLPELEDLPESDWTPINYLRQIHCIFPNFQLSGIRGGHCLVSQIFPGPTPETSITTQTILSAKKPSSPQEQADSEAFSALCLEAVGSEDYPVGLGIQAGLASGANEVFVIGRNEPGIQHYHRTVALLAGNGEPAE